MFGQVFFALWVAGVTLAGVYFGQHVPLASGDDASAASRDNVRYNDFRTDLFAIPYNDGKAVVGYVTGRFTIKTVESEEAALDIPLRTLMLDALSSHFYKEAADLATPVGWSRLRESLAELRDAANETAGRDVVAEVLIEQLDFFPKDAVRMPGDARFEETMDAEVAE